MSTKADRPDTMSCAHVWARDMGNPNGRRCTLCRAGGFIKHNANRLPQRTKVMTQEMLDAVARSMVVSTYQCRTKIRDAARPLPPVYVICGRNAYNSGGYCNLHSPLLVGETE